MNAIQKLLRHFAGYLGIIAEWFWSFRRDLKIERDSMYEKVFVALAVILAILAFSRSPNETEAAPSAPPPVVTAVAQEGCLCQDCQCAVPAPVQAVCRDGQCAAPAVKAQVSAGQRPAQVRNYRVFQGKVFTGERFPRLRQAAGFLLRR